MAKGGEDDASVHSSHVSETMEAGGHGDDAKSETASMLEDELADVDRQLMSSPEGRKVVEKINLLDGADIESGGGGGVGVAAAQGRHTLDELKAHPRWRPIAAEGKPLGEVLLRELCQQLGLDVKASSTMCTSGKPGRGSQRGFQKLIKTLGVPGVSESASSITFTAFEKWYSNNAGKKKKKFVTVDASKDNCFAKYTYSLWWVLAICGAAISDGTH